MPQEDISALDESDFKKWLSKRLIVDQALRPDDPLYEPIFEDDPADPVRLIFQDIEFSEVESLNFISGFRGSGKTTELYRLRQQLLDKGYFVVYANALDFLLPSEPVEITDFLIVLAGAFSDALVKQCGIDPAQEGFWTRFAHWLKTTEVELDGVDLKAGDTGLNFKTSLKQVPSFRRQLRQRMESRIGELRREVHDFFQFGIQKIRDKHGAEWNPVFIFDQLEQLRDTYSSEGKVADSVANLIANHREDLKIPFFHMVYTLPPWMKFKLSEPGKIRYLYNIKLWKNDEKRSGLQSGLKTMQSIVKRRFTDEGLRRFFGDVTKTGSSRMANSLIQASGGHFPRSQSSYCAKPSCAPPIFPSTRGVVQASINNLRTSFLPIPSDDAKWLHEIAWKRDSLLRDRSPESVQRMTFFLDTHCALILRNGEEWYDVHPIIREELKEIVARDTAGSSAASTQSP